VPSFAVVLSLTLFVAPATAEAALAILRAHEGVRNLVRVPGAAVETGEDLVAAAVTPAVADDVLGRLRAAGVSTDRCTLSRRGVDLVEIGQDERRFGYWDRGADVVVWDEVPALCIGLVVGSYRVASRGAATLLLGLGVAALSGAATNALGALAVLAINLACLTAGAVVTVALQRRRASR
jgi:hypothetical protein